MSALGDVVEALLRAIELHEQTTGAVIAVADEAVDALQLAEHAGLRAGVEVLAAGKDDCDRLAAQLRDGQAALEEFMARVQAVMDGT